MLVNSGVYRLPHQLGLLSRWLDLAMRAAGPRRQQPRRGLDEPHTEDTCFSAFFCWSIRDWTKTTAFWGSKTSGFFKYEYIWKQLSSAEEFGDVFLGGWEHLRTPWRWSMAMAEILAPPEVHETEKKIVGWEATYQLVSQISAINSRCVICLQHDWWLLCYFGIQSLWRYLT